MEDWLNLINAEKEKDLMALESATKIPEVKDVIVKIRELSADEKVREEAFCREMRLHDEATAINSSRREGLRKGLDKGRHEGRREENKEIRRKMIQKGYSEEEINDLLGTVN